MSDVGQLLSQFQSSRGPARSNRYRVIFNSSNGSVLNILCDSVTLPGRQIATNDYMTSMKSYKKPYAFMNEDVSISFILTNDWLTWDYIKQWQSSIINNIDTQTGAYTINLKEEYAKDVIIEHLDGQDRITKIVKLYSAFPTTLNSIELSNSSENDILRCTCTLAYDNWEERSGEFSGGRSLDLPSPEEPFQTTPDLSSLPSPEGVQVFPVNLDLPRPEQPLKPRIDTSTLPRPVPINSNIG